MPGVSFAFSPGAGDDRNGAVWGLCVAIVVCFRRCVALVSSLDVVVGLGLSRIVRFGGGLIWW